MARITFNKQDLLGEWSEEVFFDEIHLPTPPMAA
jgi:hypothetical protein